MTDKGCYAHGTLPGLAQLFKEVNSVGDIQKEIKEALEKATPGPWKSEGGTFERGDKRPAVITYFDADHGEWFIHGDIADKDDAHLIANAPTWLLHQQELIEQLQKQIKNVKESWQEQKEEIRSLRVGYTSANAREDEDLYFWEPYAENHLETLSGGVVIRAEWIRQLIQEAVEQKDVAIETLKEAISAVVSEGRSDHKKIQEKLNLIEIEAKKLLKERSQKDAEIERLQSMKVIKNYTDMLVETDRQAEEIRKLREALEELDDLLDFGDTETDNTGFIFENADGINKAFRMAYRLINPEQAAINEALSQLTPIKGVLDPDREWPEEVEEEE